MRVRAGEWRNQSMRVLPAPSWRVWLALCAALLGPGCGSKDSDPSPGTPGASGATTSGGAPSHSGASSSLAGSGSSGDAARGGNGATAGAGTMVGGTASAGGSSGGDANTGGTPGGNPSGGTALAGAAGESSCGELEDVGTPVHETQRNGEVPAPQGGAVVDGTYALTAIDIYSPASADSELYSATLRIAGGHYELVRSGGLREEGAMATMAIVLKLSPTCPARPALSKPYTATATTLSLVAVGDNRVETFTKR